MMIQRVILAEYENRCENRPGAKRQREIVNNGKALSPNRFPCGDYFGIVLSERSLKAVLRVPLPPETINFDSDIARG
jgi:hypothetical protein